MKKVDNAINFSFTAENLLKAAEIINKYPENHSQSAVMPLLFLAQEQNSNYLSQQAIEYVADFLKMPAIRVFELASFYTMYNLKPVGEFHIQVCGTTPCMLRGAEGLMQLCEKELDIKKGETTLDKKFTLTEVECLGACVNAPVVQINNDYHENLDSIKMRDLLNVLSSKAK